MNHRYLIKVSVTKGDARAHAIRMMAGNMQVGTDDLDKAYSRVEYFLRLISQLRPGRFDSYGVVTIIDEQNGKIVESTHIDNHKDPLAFDPLTDGENK